MSQTEARTNSWIDCRQDVTRLLEKGRDALLKEKRNVLTVNFLDGYANEP